MTVQANSQAIGKSWEQILISRAQSNGLLALKNHLSAFFIGGGGTKIVKSELDFCIIKRANTTSAAVVGFFDAKCLGGDFVLHSDLLGKKQSTHQIERSALYCSLGIPSGFICWLRKVDRVLFLPGDLVEKAGPGSRFTPSDGYDIGRVQDFDLRSVMRLRA